MRTASWFSSVCIWYMELYIQCINKQYLEARRNTVVSYTNSDVSCKPNLSLLVPDRMQQFFKPGKGKVTFFKTKQRHWPFCLREKLAGRAFHLLALNTGTSKTTASVLLVLKIILLFYTKN